MIDSQHMLFATINAAADVSQVVMAISSILDKGNYHMFTSQYQGFQAQPFGAVNSGVSPQGVDIGAIVNAVAQSAAQALPGLLLSLLSTHPQIQQVARQGGLTAGVNPQSQFGIGGIGFNNQSGAGVSPQGFDLSTVVNSVAQSAAQALPGLLHSLLSAHPQIQQIARQGAINPQNQFSFGANQQFGDGGFNAFNRSQFYGQQNYGQQSAGVSPQGFDLGAIVNSVAHSAAQALPGLLLSLLSAHPQIQQIARHGGATFGGVHQQGLFGAGANTPFSAGGLNIFDNNRSQFGGQQNTGAASQGVDLNAIVNSVAQSAAQALPGLLLNLLSAHPQINQIARQGGAVAGGLNQGANAFGANSQYGAAGASPQGFDLGSLAQNVASIISPQIPGIVGNVVGQVLGNQQTVH
jgi:hypothetical protein